MFFPIPITLKILESQISREKIDLLAMLQKFWSFTTVLIKQALPNRARNNFSQHSNMPLTENSPVSGSS